MLKKTDKGVKDFEIFRFCSKDDMLLMEKKIFENTLLKAKAQGISEAVARIRKEMPKPFETKIEESQEGYNIAIKHFNAILDKVEKGE